MFQHLSSNISNMRKNVHQDCQTPRSGLKKKNRGTAEFFDPLLGVCIPDDLYSFSNSSLNIEKTKELIVCLLTREYAKRNERVIGSSCLRESSGTSPKVPKSSQPLSFLCSKSPELIQTSSPSVNLG